MKLVERSQQVVDRIRSGEGPWFFEVSTYRWREHVGPGRDYHLGYRAESECEPWVATDPIKLLGEEMFAAQRAEIEAEVEAEIAEAFGLAESSA